MAPLSLALSVGLSGCKDDGEGDGDAGGTGTESDTSDPSATETMDPSATETSPTDPSATDTSPTDPSATDTTDPTETDTSVDGTTGEPSEAIAFRFTSMYIRDPHFYVSSLIGCIDATDDILVGDAINEQFNAAINNDDPDMPDGYLDLSLLLIFRGLDQSDGGGGTLDFANGQCTAPVQTTVCDLLPNSELQGATYASQAEGICHEPDPAHLSSANYNPKPGSTPGPCFHAGPTDVTIVTTGFDLSLQDTEIAATYVGDPAGNLVTGTLRGFLSSEVAGSTELPPDVQQDTGATYIAELLPGGPNNCANHNDLDGGGWWFYVDFTAQQVDWVGP